MGLVYVVTGGGSGLGAATVSRLAALPATVFALDLHFAEPLADDPSQRGANRCVHCIQCDVTDNLSVTSAVQTVQAALPSEFVGVDGVVHCAGINLGGPLMEMTSDDLEKVFAVNTIGVLRVQRALFPLLRRAMGITVFVSSEVALVGAATAFSGPYAASKIALEALATSLRQELSMLDPPLPIVVVNPGATQTPMLDTAVESNFTKHLTTGSAWAGALERGRATALSYMRRHACPAESVAEAIVNAICATPPPHRVVINASWEMRLLAWVPQRLIDAAVRWSIGPAIS